MKACGTYIVCTQVAIQTTREGLKNFFKVIYFSLYDHCLILLHAYFYYSLPMKAQQDICTAFQ